MSEETSIAPANFEKAIHQSDGANLLIFAVLTFAGLIVAANYKYLLFHTLAEGFSIIVACCVFMLAWNLRRLLENDYLPFIGIAYLFVAILDFIHMISYQGISIIASQGPDTATQFWIAARYMESTALLISPLFFRFRVKPHLLFLIFSIITALLIYAVFSSLFPSCFIPGSGLTLFKVASEYLICFILTGALVVLYFHRRFLYNSTMRLMVASIVVTIMSEMAFTLYQAPYGLFNELGHFLKIISFYLIYRAIIVGGLRRPLDVFYQKLKENRDALDSANQELERFSSSVSHDLRNDLNNISVMSSILRDFHMEKLDDEGKECVMTISEGIVLMSNNIKALLRLAKNSKKGLRITGVDLSEMAQNIIDKLKTIDLYRNVNVKIKPGLFINADKDLIYNVLENLLENACKYTSREKEPRIEFGCHQKESHSIFFVRDNGHGFPMEKAENLFLPFERLHNQQDFSGSGIGLSIAHKIITDHGGKIWGESEKGKGSTFYFTLPE